MNRQQIFIKALLLAVFFLTLLTINANAQLPGYKYRLKGQTIGAQVSGTTDLTNFPVLMSFTLPALRSTGNGGLVENVNGYDMIFTAANGSTILSHQLETYNPSTGQIEVWVRFPTLLATANTPFYLHFGNPSISTDQSSSNVWDSNYKMVLHFNNSMNDASGEGSNAIDSGTIDAAGQISRARNYNSNNDFIYVPDPGVSPLDITGNITISFWVNIANRNNGPDLVTKGTYTDGYSTWVDGNGRLRFQINNDALVTGTNQISNGTWSYLAFTRASNGDRFIYNDGDLVTSDNSPSSFNTNNDPLYIGNSTYDFRGLMDEVRISNVTRSADWIKTEYNNQFAPLTFVAQINAEPVLRAIEGSTITYNSGSPATTITSTVTVSDGDDTNIESASIQISANFATTEDILAFSDQNGITGSYSSATGILTLTGTSSLANYQTALRSITYRNISAAPSELTRTISFTLNDGDDNSNTVTRNINVVKTNNAPVLSSIESDPIIYYAGNGQKIITNSILVTDSDDANMESATISISSGFNSSEDVLAFTDANGITGSYASGTGILTLSGSATKATYQAALRTITYENTENPTDFVTRTISIVINDGTENSTNATRDVDFPSNITELASYKANDVFHFDMQDADGDGNPGTNQPANGALTTMADRSDNVTTSTTDLSFTANSAAEEAILNASYLGNRSGLLFDGIDDYYERTSDNALLNLNPPFDEKSFSIVFRTGNDVSTLQFLYEQGGGTRGYILAIENNLVYATRYDRNLSGSVNDYSSISFGSIQPNTSYILTATHDASGGNTNWSANINGGAITTLTNAPTMLQHTGNASIGNADGNTRHPNGSDASVSSESVPFKGYMAEFVSWNSVLSSTDFTNIYGFLSDKWFNKLPVLSDIEISSLDYNEADPATTISTTITIADEDDTNLDSARVYISSGFNSSEDVLSGSGTGITSSYNSATGILSLTGTTSIANYQAALRSVTYQNTESTSPSTTTREINFEVYDWDGASATISRNINIIPSNDIPVLANLEGTIIAFTEDDGPTQITSTLTVSDTDNTNLQGATVAFTNNYFLGEDILDYSNALGITGSFNSTDGVLTLSGTTTIANYQAALRAVTFENISSDPVIGLNRTIEIRVFDGIDSSITGTTRDISITNLNTPPTLSNIEPSSIFYAVSDSIEISETITLIDPDDSSIETVTFQITSNYTNSEDTLVYDNIFGIVGSWNDISGELTLTGPASKLDFQSAIRTVRYANTTLNPTDLPRTISITANDGDDASNTLTRIISLSIPKSVPELLLWLKGDAGTFTTTGGATPSSQGSNVGRWEDQSGNGNHFISSATSPILQTNVTSINSQRAIEFPGGSGTVRLEDSDAETQYLNGLDELTIFFVLESDIVNTDRGFWTTSTPNNIDRYFSLRYDATGDNGGANDVITVGMRDLTPAFVMESFEDAQTASPQIVMLKWKSELNYELYVDGVLSNPTYLTNIPSGVLTNLTTAIIGQGTRSANTTWDGLIAEVILYGAEISIDDQNAVEDYLSLKYDVAIRSLTAATGGKNISADDANTAFTTLTGPRVQESFAGEFTNGGTFVFKAPTGFQWDTGGTPPSASVLPAFGGSTALNISFTSRTANQITFTISSPSTTNPGEITFANLRVQPTTGILPNTGKITNIGTTGLGGSTNYGTLIMVPGTQVEMEFSQQPSASNVSSNISPSIRVQLIDQFGNSVQESRVDISLALNTISGSGSLSGTTSVQTNIFGIAEFDAVNVDAVGTYSLTASSAGLTDATSDNFNIVVLGQLTQFLVQRVPFGNIADKLAGQNFNITIIAVDGVQDTVKTFTGTANISSNCTMGTGSGPTTNFVGGVISSKTVSISNIGTCSITATNAAGSESGTSNTFDVTPGAASPATSTITASPTAILNNGFSTSTITVQVKDSQGNNKTTGGASITLSTTDGSLSSITDNGNGTYTATLTSSVVEGIATITGTLNTVAITDNAQVEFAAFNNLWQSSVGSVSNARNWDLATNWSSGSVPLPGDKVLIPANPAVGNEHPVINTTNTTIAQLSIEASGSVTVSGGKEFIVTGEISGDGEVLGSNTDSVTVGGNLNISDVSVGYVKLNGTINQDVSTPNEYVNLELDNVNGADFFADLTVTDSLKLTNGTLFMPTGTNLIANSKWYGSGNIRMQRRISGVRGWRILSSPFNTTYGDFLDGTLTQGYTGSTLGAAPLDSLQPNVLTYLENFIGTDNQRYRAPSNISDTVAHGKGVFVYIFGNIATDPRYNDPLPDTLDVQGQEWNGNDTEVNFNVTYTADADTGWNLVGNPYLATIDWDDSPNWTKTNIESTIYIWDPDANGGNGEYLTWNGVTGTLPNGGLIAPFQGFWVKANAPSPVLSVKKDAKTTGGSFLRKEIPNKSKSIDVNENKKSKVQSFEDPQIQLSITSESGRSKKTSLMFSREGLAGKDKLDAFRLLPLSTSHIEFYSLLNNGTELAINNLPLEFNSRVSIPLHVNYYEDGMPKSGELKLVWGGLRNIPEDWILTLIDNETGTEINILEELSYTFNHSTKAKIARSTNPLSPTTSVRRKSASQSTRFTLKLSTEQIERDVPEEVFLSQNYPNPFNPTTTIPFGLNENSKVSLVIYDILGRKVSTLIDSELTAGRYNPTFIGSHLASGVYFYRLTTHSKVIVKKFTLIK